LKTKERPEWLGLVGNATVQTFIDVFDVVSGFVRRASAPWRAHCVAAMGIRLRASDL
jgi:hypothetical protein